MGERDLEYGLISIAGSVFFLIASLDLLESTIFSRELSSLLAYVLVALGAYVIARASK